MLCQQLTDGAHELAPRVNLKELRPPQGARLVNPSKAIGDLCRNLASQGLSLFVAAGEVNDRESITEGFLFLLKKLKLYKCDESSYSWFHSYLLG